MLTSSCGIPEKRPQGPGGEAESMATVAWAVLAGLDPSTPVGAPAEAGNVGEGSRGAAGASGWTRSTWETLLPVLTFEDSRTCRADLIGTLSFSLQHGEQFLRAVWKKGGRE